MKVSVVGGGNAGVFSALFLNHVIGAEVELIYDPTIPCERVGQATVLDPPKILHETTGFDWYNNPIHATFKSGILYEGWGQVNEEVFHPFPPDRMGMHYCPWEMQNYVLNSGLFKVIEGKIDPKDVDADYVFDCRGKPDDYSNYEQLLNPTNACILAKPNWDTSNVYWSRHIATPDGWTFIIPTNTKSPSHTYCVGYCYNNTITSKEDAEKNMLEMFDVEISKHVNYNNYVAKNILVDDRIILNGNRLFFIEPLESSSTQTYIEVVLRFGRTLQLEGKLDNLNHQIHTYIKHIQNFVLWHYQFGSKYNTPFWDYAKKLTFNDHVFDSKVKESIRLGWKDIHDNISLGKDRDYGYWDTCSFKYWYEGMTHFYKKGT